MKYISAVCFVLALTGASAQKGARVESKDQITVAGRPLPRWKPRWTPSSIQEKKEQIQSAQGPNEGGLVLNQGPRPENILTVDREEPQQFVAPNPVADLPAPAPVLPSVQPGSVLVENRQQLVQPEQPRLTFHPQVPSFVQQVPVAPRPSGLVFFDQPRLGQPAQPAFFVQRNPVLSNVGPNLVGPTPQQVVVPAQQHVVVPAPQPVVVSTPQQVVVPAQQQIAVPVPQRVVVPAPQQTVVPAERKSASSQQQLVPAQQRYLTPVQRFVAPIQRYVAPLQHQLVAPVPQNVIVPAQPEAIVTPSPVLPAVVPNLQAVSENEGKLVFGQRQFPAPAQPSEISQQQAADSVQSTDSEW